MPSKLSNTDYQRLKDLVYKYLMIDLAIETGDVRQTRLDNWTSSRHLGLIMEIESAFNVKFKINEVTEMLSFSEIAFYLEQKL